MTNKLFKKTGPVLPLIQGKQWPQAAGGWKNWISNNYSIYESFLLYQAYGPEPPKLAYGPQLW